MTPRPRALACVRAGHPTLTILLGFVLALVLVGIGPSTGRAGAQASNAGNDSADRLIFWKGCEQVVSLTDAELDEWKSWGVDGFACMTGRLRGLGGSQDFTGDPDANLRGSNYELQRLIRDSRIVERADARGMKLYLGVKLSSYWNTATPLGEWFDDAGWSELVLPEMRDLAAAARQLGFAGLAFDQELYPQRSGVRTATWRWDYPGNTHTEAEVRAKATRRGEQLMSAILDGFPGAELAVYWAFFPGDWNEVVQEQNYGTANASSARLDIDFWDGMTRVEGYTAIRFWDNMFYKSPHKGTWDGALTYNQNAVSATLSRRFSNWDYASSRIHISPFSWIDPGPSEASGFDDARPPDYVREQLLAFRKWGMGGEFANFVYGSLNGFDYSPYVRAMQEASTPGNVDGVAPTVRVTSEAAASGDPETIAGIAHDNLAIRAVRWRDDRGGSGVAELSWKVLAGNSHSGYRWEMRWSLPTSDLSPGATEVTVTAEDIKGHTSAPAVAPAEGSPVPDVTPPQTVITSGPPRISRSSSARFWFRSSEAGSTFECRLDSRSWTGCSQPKRYARLIQGRHRFLVRAEDSDGNLDPTPANHAFRVRTDRAKARPRIITKPGKRLRIKGRGAMVAFRVSGNENASGFLCTLDDSDARRCQVKPIRFRIRASRRWKRHEFEVRTIKASGETGARLVRYRFKVRRRR
jgi:hypothetical protein